MIGCSSSPSSIWIACLLVLVVAVALGPFAAIPVAAQPQFPGADGLAVGDEICVFGFVMDSFCVERGTLLDAPEVVTLQNPELHSLHCLLDVPSCNGSPYHILEPPAEAGGDYGTGWQMSSNDMLLEVGRVQGSLESGCTTCQNKGGGGGNLTRGFRAQVKGTIQALEPTPILTVGSVEALDGGMDSVGCQLENDNDAVAPSDTGTGNATSDTGNATDPATDNMGSEEEETLNPSVQAFVDSCLELQYTSCQECTAVGCYWCPHHGYCHGLLDPHGFCAVEKDWYESCNATTTNFYNDPLFDASKWAYDILNILPAWEAGYTGRGIHIQVVDSGVDATHPEFAARFNITASCQNYLPCNITEDDGCSHGTHVAGIAAGEANNGVCSAGMAPNATISACPLEDHVEGAFTVAIDLANADISTNSWNNDACVNLIAERRRRRRRRRRRKLQDDATSTGEEEEEEEEACPLVPGEGDSPPPPLFSEECQLLFDGVCYPGFEKDVEFCNEWVWLFTKCTYNKLTPEESSILQRAVNEGRDGKGIIFTFASGNEYEIGETVNMEGLLNTRYTISVGAVDQGKVHAQYSTSGSAALFISGPGGDSDYASQHLTAKVGGGCEDSGEGTSYATPAVAGGIALVLEANPNLGWRDVQGILASTAQKFDGVNPTWSTNKAGYHHSPLYGFGVMDVWAAIQAAKSWTKLGPEIVVDNQSGDVNVTIGDATGTPATTSLELDGGPNFIIESVMVYVQLDHVSRGDLEIRLESPEGTTTTLLPAFRSETNYWIEPLELMSVVSWGENPSGKWTLTLIDKMPGNQVGCSDMTFSSLLTDEEGVTMADISCDAMVEEKVCADGVVNQTAVDENVAQYGLAIFLDDSTGTPFDEACCACGGGVPAPDDRVNRLVTWNLTAYGHEKGWDGTVTLSPGETGTDNASEVPANGTTTTPTNNDTTTDNKSSAGRILRSALIIALAIGTALAAC